MDQSDQESIFVQAAIHADAVIVRTRCMPVIAQDTLSAAGDRKVNFVAVKVFQQFFRRRRRAGSC